MKVAITIRDDMPFNQTLLVNGISQNAVFLYDVLKNCGHQPYFMHFNSVYQPPTEVAGQPYDFLLYESVLTDCVNVDVLLELGVALSQEQRLKLRDMFATKVVVMRLGNSYWMDLENILFKPNEVTDGPVVSGADQVWISPHFELTKQYHEALNQCSAQICPFLWDSTFISQETINFPKGPLRDIYVMEPNINVVKNALIPLCVISEVFKKDPELFGKATILNGLHFNDKPLFLRNIIANLPGTSSRLDKVFFSGRYSFNQVFANPGILLGFHYQNGLNYLYNEALYSGVPLVHNSEFMQEIGYYYSEFDIKGAAVQVENALGVGFNQKQINENRAFLERFSPNNREVQSAYNSLLYSLF